MRKIDKVNRLTPFEEYMYWDESPAFPMYSWQTLLFSGKMDRTALCQSFADAVLRHPLMNSRVVTRRKKLFWEPSDIVPEIEFLDASVPESEVYSPDIRKTSGLKFCCWFLEGENGNPQTKIGMMVHHSVADGLGCQVFLDDLLLGYAKRRGAELAPDAFPVISETSMEYRQNPDITWKRYFRLLSHGTKTTRDLVFRRTEGLLPLRRADRKNPPEHPVLSKSFLLSAEETAAYRAYAKKLGVTINDLILRDFFLATADFKRMFAPKSDKWIRIAMPINMRTPKTPSLFATNVVSMVFLDRRPSQVVETGDFLQNIHKETDWIKRTDQGLSLLENLRGRRDLPGGIEMELRGNRCWSTTVVSNLGVLFKNTKLPRTEDGKLIAGDVQLEEFAGMPPVRAKTFTGWGIWTYAGKLGMAMRYDERYLTPEQVEFAFEACRKRIFTSVLNS